MQIFEYPYIIITIFVICFIILGAIGALFALQGLKTAKGTGEVEFSNVSKLENKFDRMGKQRYNRSLIYISVSLDNVRSLYSDSKAWGIFAEIKPILLKTFTDDEGGTIAVYDQKNFIALNKWESNAIKGKIKQCLNEIDDVVLRNKAVNMVDINIGYYCALTTEIGFDEAINRAKQACTMAENDNISCAEWTNNSGKALEKRIKIENNIENEIDNNRFFLEYQPVVDAKTKRIVGAEVLSRLNSENDGVLTPGSFLSAVNSVGINDKFDYYIFEKNCKWISNNREEREKYIYTINFSRTTLCDASFVKNITNIVEKYNLSYSSLAVEILEDKAVDGDAREQLTQNLVDLKEKGILVLLDDFGNGYTTFGDLNNFGIDIVKIDKSIVHNSTSEKGLVILKNIVRTAKDLGYRTVCEGIENAEHEKAAIESGCDMLQGYYYYRPMPVARLESVFSENIQ